MRLDELLEDAVFDAPLALAYLAGGLLVWVRRGRLGRVGVVAAGTLVALLGLHFATGVALRLVVDALNANTRAAAGQPDSLRWAFRTLLIGRQVVPAVGLLILVRCALAGRGRLG